MIEIKNEEIEIKDCISVIIVPEIAMREAGYIKTLTVKADANAKHEFHAMAQVAYFQYQDDELKPVVVTRPLTISYLNTTEKLESGMLIYHDSGGEFHVLIHTAIHTKKILEAAYRYCTRWVRLDI
jgi:hypothetical protein